MYSSIKKKSVLVTIIHDSIISFVIIIHKTILYFLVGPIDFDFFVNNVRVTLRYFPISWS